MSLFNALRNLFSKSDKGAQKKKKKATGKKAANADLPLKKGKKNAGKKKALKKPANDIPLKLEGKTKGRKKSEQVHAGPIDEEALGFTISLKNDQASKRNTLRISVEGLKVYLPRLNKTFDVADISPTGLGFKFEKPRVKGGVMLKMDLVLDGKNEAVGIMCKVMRHERGKVGCAFVELDRAQDDAVHKIVLLGQKQQAARKAAQRDKDFKLPA